MSAVADDDGVARPDLDDEDACADVDDEDARAAVEDVDARAAVDDDEARATDDFGAAVTAEESTDLDPELAATVFQSNGKEKNKRQEQNQGFCQARCPFPCDWWSPLNSYYDARSTPNTGGRTKAQTQRVQIQAKSTARKPVEPKTTWCYHM